MKFTLSLLFVLVVTALVGGQAVPAPLPSQESGDVELGYRAVEPMQRVLRVTLRDVRVVVGGAEIEAETAVVSRVDGRVRLALPNGGTVTLPDGADIRLVGRDGKKPLYDLTLMLLLRR